MENPFKKFFGKAKLAVSLESLEEELAQEDGVENKEVVGYGSEMRDGVVYMWKKYGDGSSDYNNAEALRSDASNTEGVRQEMQSKLQEWGVNSEE